jgi:hypothetical protein
MSWIKNWRNEDISLSDMLTTSGSFAKARKLNKLGIAHEYAITCGNARKKYWHMSKIKWVAIAMPERYFKKI